MRRVAPHHFHVLRTGKHLVDNKPRQIAIGRDEVEVAFHALANPFLQRQFPIADGTQDDVAQHPQLPRDDALKELVFRAEIVMQHGVGDASPLRDRGSTRTSISFFHEFLFRRMQDSCFRVLRITLFRVHNIITLV